jgi:hypothetical protein
MTRVAVRETALVGGRHDRRGARAGRCVEQPRRRLVDRWNRRRILIADYVVQALAVAGLPGLAAGAGLWLVYAVAVVQASTATLGRPARRALLPSLVRAWPG